MQVCILHLVVKLVSNFFKSHLDLFGYGIQVITPCFCVILKDPVRYP